MLVKFQVNKFYISFFSVFILCHINAQIALPTFHGVQKYHPPPNYAHSFDGVDDIISCGDITNLRRPGYFTVMFWFKRTQDNSGTSYDSNHKTNNIMYSKGSDPNNDNIEIGSEGSEIEIYLDSAGGDDELSFDAGISNDTWYHLAVTYDQDQSDETTLFIDGSEVKSWNDASGILDQSTGSPVTIGDTDHISAPFTGQIDEVTVWTSVLTPSQISAIYNSGSGIGDVTTNYSDNLELYIKFEQDLSDDSGNSHDGTFSGSSGTNSSATYVNITSSIPLD
jgi:hypothetical protein